MVFSENHNTLYKSKDDLIKKCTEKKTHSLLQTQNLFPEVRNISQVKFSLISTRGHENNTINIAVADENKVSEVRIKLDKLNVRNKINFHKQANIIIYVDLLQSTLEISKLNTKLSKLERELKQEVEKLLVHILKILKL